MKTNFRWSDPQENRKINSWRSRYCRSWCCALLLLLLLLLTMLTKSPSSRIFLWFYLIFLLSLLLSLLLIFFSLLTHFAGGGATAGWRWKRRWLLRCNATAIYRESNSSFVRFVLAVRWFANYQYLDVYFVEHTTLLIRTGCGNRLFQLFRSGKSTSEVITELLFPRIALDWWTRARTVRYQRQLTKRTFTKVLLVTFRPPQTREGHADNDGDEVSNLLGWSLARNTTSYNRSNVLRYPFFFCFQVRNSVLSHWIIWSTEKLTPHGLRKQKKTRNESTFTKIYGGYGRNANAQLWWITI